MWSGSTWNSVSDWEALWSEVLEGQEAHPPGRLCHQPAMRSSAHHPPSASCGGWSCSSVPMFKCSATLPDSTEGEVSAWGHIRVPAPWCQWPKSPGSSCSVHKSFLRNYSMPAVLRSWVFSLVGFSGNRITEQSGVQRSYYLGKRRKEQKPRHALRKNKLNNSNKLTFRQGGALKMVGWRGKKHQHPKAPNPCRSQNTLFKMSLVQLSPMR